MVHICSWCEAVNVGKGEMRSQVIMCVLAVAVSQRRWWRRALVWSSLVPLFFGVCGIVETKIDVVHVKWLSRRRCADFWLLKLDTEVLPSSVLSTKPGGYGSASSWLLRFQWRINFGSGSGLGHTAVQAEVDLSRCYSSWWSPEASFSFDSTSCAMLPFSTVLEIVIHKVACMCRMSPACMPDLINSAERGSLNR